MSRNIEELVRRLAAALRAAELYAPQHPLVQRSVAALNSALTPYLGEAQFVVVGLIGEDIVVNETRLGKGSASLTGFVRGLQDREIEKITFHRGITLDEIKAFLSEVADRRARQPITDRLEARGVRRIVVGRLSVEDTPQDAIGIEAARRVYRTAVSSAETLWEQAKAGEKPRRTARR